MTLPLAVSKAIENYVPNAEDEQTEALMLVDRNNIAHAEIIRLLVMKDVMGKVQIILPSDCMLDVDRLNKALGRELSPLPPEELATIQRRLAVASLPAIPDITGFETVADSRVFERQAIYLESGDAEKLIKLRSDLFRQMTQNAKTAEIGVPLKDIHPNRDDPRQDVEQINTAISKFTSLRIQQRLQDTLELPPLPETAQRVMQLRVDPDASINELADVVEMDPSLSAQVVSWASSSFYATPGKVRSVHDAIIRVLGFDLVLNLAMGLALGKTLNTPKDAPQGYTPYWQSAVFTATGMGMLLNAMPREQRPEFGLAYLAGLLHNFGYLVLAHVFPPHAKLINRYIEANPHVDPSYVEHHLIGITSEQVSSQLMDVWNMPEEIVTALRQHKNPDYDGPYAEYAQLAALTRAMLAKRGIGQACEPVPAAIIEQLNIDTEKADSLLDEMMSSAEELEKIAEMLE